MGNEIIKDIDRIAIEKDKIYLYGPKMENKGVFDRQQWEAIIDDARQIQTFKDYTLIIFDKKFVGCEVDTRSRRLFCGLKPEEMSML